jgi:hypothetical protein
LEAFIRLALAYFTPDELESAKLAASVKHVENKAASSALALPAGLASSISAAEPWLVPTPKKRASQAMEGGAPSSKAMDAVFAVSQMRGALGPVGGGAEGHGSLTASDGGGGGPLADDDRVPHAVAAVRRAVEEHLVPAVAQLFSIAPGDTDEPFSNLFRRERMYCEPVDAVLKRWATVTKELFTRYTDEASGTVTLQQWLPLLTRLGVFDGSVHARVNAGVAQLEAHAALKGSNAAASTLSMGRATSPDRSSHPTVSAKHKVEHAADVAYRVATSSNAHERSSERVRSISPSDTPQNRPATAPPAQPPEFNERDARTLFLFSIMTVVSLHATGISDDGPTMARVCR